MCFPLSLIYALSVPCPAFPPSRYSQHKTPLGSLYPHDTRFYGSFPAPQHAVLSFFFSVVPPFLVHCLRLTSPHTHLSLTRMLVFSPILDKRICHDSPTLEERHLPLPLPQNFSLRSVCRLFPRLPKQVVANQPKRSFSCPHKTQVHVLSLLHL